MTIYKILYKVVKRSANGYWYLFGKLTHYGRMSLYTISRISEIDLRKCEDPLTMYEAVVTMNSKKISLIGAFKIVNYNTFKGWQS